MSTIPFDEDDKIQYFSIRIKELLKNKDGFIKVVFEQLTKEERASIFSTSIEFIALWGKFEFRDLDQREYFLPRLSDEKLRVEYYNLIQQSRQLLIEKDHVLKDLNETLTLTHTLAKEKHELEEDVEHLKRLANNDILQIPDKRSVIYASLEFYSEYASKVYTGNLVPQQMQKAKDLITELYWGIENQDEKKEISVNISKIEDQKYYGFDKSNNFEPFSCTNCKRRFETKDALADHLEVSDCNK